MPDASQGPLAIGLLTHSVNPRGGVVHTLELADALHERGHRVTVFVPAFAGQSLFRSTRCDIELVPLTERTGSVVEMVATRRAALVQHLGRTLARRDFHVLHAQDGIGGNALADLVETGVIEGFTRTVHHLDHFEDARLMAWQARAFTAACQVLCVSRTWCDRLAQEFGVHAKLVHNGVDLRRYTRRPAAQDAGVVARHGLRPGGPMFLAVGGVEERKNTLRMLQAFLAFRVHRPAAQLVIAGGASLLDHDAYGQQFSALLAASGAADAVVITGTVADDEMPALFRAADVLLMASLREGFGLVVLEALASGTPTVVSRIAPFTEYLPGEEHLGHCCWADPYSVDEITAAMRRACEPVHAEALASGTPPVCERFSWQSSAAAHEAIYRARRARPHRPAAQRLEA